jgi:hypothetical protein
MLVKKFFRNIVTTALSGSFDSSSPATGGIGRLRMTIAMFAYASQVYFYQ